MDAKTKMQIKEWNEFWGRLFKYNLSLLKKSEKEQDFGKESFENIIDFYLTSQAQALIKGILLQQNNSPGTLLAARCFLEGLAIKKKYKRGEISELQIELLRQQVFIIEYNHYKNFSDIAEVVLFSENLEKNYKVAVELFQEKLTDRFSRKQIKEIVKSDIPFLCDPRTNYRKLIAENLGEDYARLYGIYSQAIHPSTNDFYYLKFIEDTLPLVMEEVLKEYRMLDPADLTFYAYKAGIYSSDIAQEYEGLIEKECKVLNGISEVFNRFFPKSYVSDTLRSISLTLQDVCSDKLLGLSESAKSKWKVILDCFSAFHFVYVKCFPEEEHYKLLEEHTAIQMMRNLEKDFSDESKKAYTIYKEIYPNGVDFVSFKNGFLTTSGYTIDEMGQSQSLTKLVKEFLKKMPHSEDPVKALDRHLMLNYVESQMVSHANGYLWYANAGSFCDINNTIMGTDICLTYLLKTILVAFQMHRSIEKSKEYKQIINVLRNGIKKIENIGQRKGEILKLPMVNL